MRSKLGRIGKIGSTICFWTAVLPILIAIPAFVSEKFAGGLVYSIFLLWHPGSTTPFFAVLALIVASLLTLIASLLGKEKERRIGFAYSASSLLVEALFFIPATLGIMGADIHGK